MSAQLIYRTEDPRAIAWLVATAAHHEDLHDQWRGMIRDLTGLYGLADGEPRELLVQEGLVGGFRCATMESAPEGWALNDIWGGFVPDPATHTGRSWQSRIDELPANEMPDTADIGMPSMISVVFVDDDPVQFTTELHLPADESSVYALWSERGIKPALDEILAESSDVIWREVPRSVWYKLIEDAEEAEV